MGFFWRIDTAVLNAGGCLGRAVFRAPGRWERVAGIREYARLGARESLHNSEGGSMDENVGGRQLCKGEGGASGEGRCCVVRGAAGGRRGYGRGMLIDNKLCSKSLRQCGSIFMSFSAMG